MIYWDNNATAPLRKRVKERMSEAFELYEGNPNSSHSLGQASRAAIEKARRRIAEEFGCQPGEIIFTASATESNFLALWGLWFSRTQEKPERRKILVSPIEHSSVHENSLALAEKFGAEVVWLPLDNRGLIDLEKTEKVLRINDFAFCCCLGAHNETGVIQPWESLAKLCEESSVPFHTDLVQYVGRLPFHLKKSLTATATLSFHKIGGPKGVGILFQRERVKMDSILRGGSQEKKRRGGTENLMAILGAEAATEELSELRDLFQSKVFDLRNQFEKDLKFRLPDITIVGEKSDRLPNTSYILFPGAKSDVLLMSLDFKGICASSGSACSSGIVLPSRALLSLGYTEAEALSAIRFSLGLESNIDDVDLVVEAVEGSVSKLAA